MGGDLVGCRLRFINLNTRREEGRRLGGEEIRRGGERELGEKERRRGGERELGNLELGEFLAPEFCSLIP